jgi:hypothetical protein
MHDVGCKVFSAQPFGGVRTCLLSKHKCGSVTVWRVDRYYIYIYIYIYTYKRAGASQEGRGDGTGSTERARMDRFVPGHTGMSENEWRCYSLSLSPRIRPIFHGCNTTIGGRLPQLADRAFDATRLLHTVRTFDHKRSTGLR